MDALDYNVKNRLEEIMPAHLALKSTCQLYQWKDNERKKLIANGCLVLFQHNLSYYCFSNAHVLADAQLEKTFFLLKDATAMTVGGDYFFSLPFTSDKRQDDYLDIAIVKLNPPVADRLLQNGHAFLTLNQIATLPTLTQSDKLLIAGYPASKTEIDFKKMALKFKPLILKTEPYLRKLKSEVYTQGYHHIVEYRINSLTDTPTGKKRRGPLPHGISGSGLWLYPNNNEQSSMPMLIGILSEYQENSAIIISTKIDFFLDITRLKFDASIHHNGIKIELEYLEK